MEFVKAEGDVVQQTAVKQAFLEEDAEQNLRQAGGKGSAGYTHPKDRLVLLLCVNSSADLEIKRIKPLLCTIPRPPVYSGNRK